jgi:hypothetical protein
VTVPRPSRPGTPTAVLVTVVLVVLVAAVAPHVGTLLGGPDGPGPGPPLGAVLDEADRRALDAEPVRRGADPPPVDPAVDLTDPAAVARAYLTAARAGDPDDGGRTRLRAAGYAVPGSPPGTVGVLVLDPPPPGQVRTASVATLDLVAADPADRRRGYRASVATATGPPGGAAVLGLVPAYVVLARQPDGRWLVTTDTPESAEVSH